MILSSRRRAASSPKTRGASAGRSSSPSAPSTPAPNAVDDLGQPVGAAGHHLAGQPVGVDDDCAALASRSATALLPAPIPPVSPTRMPAFTARCSRHPGRNAEGPATARWGPAFRSRSWISSCRRRASPAARRAPRRWPGCRTAPRPRAPEPASRRGRTTARRRGAAGRSRVERGVGVGLAGRLHLLGVRLPALAGVGVLLLPRLALLLEALSHSPVSGSKPSG